MNALSFPEKGNHEQMRTEGLIYERSNVDLIFDGGTVPRRIWPSNDEQMRTEGLIYQRSNVGLISIGGTGPGRI